MQKSFRHIHLICALLTLQDFAMLVLHCFISGNKYARGIKHGVRNSEKMLPIDKSGASFPQHTHQK